MAQGSMNKQALIDPLRQKHDKSVGIVGSRDGTDINMLYMEHATGLLCSPSHVFTLSFGIPVVSFARHLQPWRTF